MSRTSANLLPSLPESYDANVTAWCDHLGDGGSVPAAIAIGSLHMVPHLQGASVLRILRPRRNPHVVEAA
jgi:hypothetical protein